MKGKIQSFMDKLKKMKGRDYFENYMIFLLAPVITKVKPSSTVTLKKSSKEYLIWNNNKDIFYEKLNLNHKVLRDGENSIILLVYSKENLENLLNEKEIKKFLIKLGYDMDKNLEEVLNNLVYRYSLYHCPHELGIFLGIPLNDVVDFMECTSKKCLLCGYWKVFNDFNDAQITFNNYDKSKEFALDYIMEERNREDIIFNLNRAFIRDICI